MLDSVVSTAAKALKPVTLDNLRKKPLPWTRGRVGDVGATKLLGPFEQAGAEKEFISKFR